MLVFPVSSYQLITFNDFGEDINKNVQMREPTNDVVRFRQEIIGLEFESYNGGRDSKERLMQGLLRAVEASPPKSLIVVFTDNGSKNLKLKQNVMKIKEEKGQEIFIVLTPDYEGEVDDDSIKAYEEIAQVYNISEVGAETFLGDVEQFEKRHCI